MERDEYFDMADRFGILIMPGWTCCDAWEKWGQWTPEQMTIASASLADQITRLRNHPSVFVFLNGSDNPPPADVEQMYLGIEKELEIRTALFDPFQGLSLSRKLSSAPPEHPGRHVLHLPTGATATVED